MGILTRERTDERAAAESQAVTEFKAATETQPKEQATRETTMGPGAQPGGGLKLMDYASKAPTVSHDVLCKDLLDMFMKSSDNECVVIINDSGAICGLAMRNRFSYKLAHRYSVALFYNKPALQLTDREPVVVPADTDPRKLMDLAMSRQGDSLYDCIIITVGGRYVGILTINDLLRMSKDLQQQAVEEQKDTLQSAKRRVEEIEGVANHVRESAMSGDELSMQMVDLTLKGKTELTQIKESFQIIEQSSQQQELRMKELRQETGAISTISRLIKELAETCNLLAINASIEAARAGEYGRGFSVVAGEFMSLADQTKKSAIEITAITDSVIDSIVQTAALVEEGRRLTETSGRHVEAANEVYHDIFKAAADNRNSARAIGELASEAHQQSQQVAQEMERLRQSYS